MEETGSGLFIVVDGVKVFIPKGERARLVALAHSIHLAADMMWTTVRELWYWNTLKIDLQVHARDCTVCRYQDISKPRQ